ncbi:MAG: chromosome segregation ATPase, partial [Vallitaleaceae bacterium]|nr:chromosome segregation ATPase [Vallitaleaceae bacterium]
MPTISKIRFTNVIYEGGGKRYNDETFQFDGHNGAIVLENGGGKTVFIQTAIQAVVPHMDLADRKIKDTLSLENGAAHVAIEWIVNDSPRRYAVTAVTLFIENNAVNSYKYAYEYGGEDANNIDNIPFVCQNSDRTLRPASKGEILDYYQKMAKNFMSAKMFDTIKEYHAYIEENFKIIESEWQNIGIVNSAEGDVDKYFDGCKTTTQLLNKLLIPVVEKAIEGAYQNDFAKTFEKQREHFKKNKILLEQIEESQETRVQLQKYIDVYEKLNQKEADYNEARDEAKALFHFVQNKLEGSQKQLVFFDEKLRAIEETN